MVILPSAINHRSPARSLPVSQSPIPYAQRSLSAGTRSAWRLPVELLLLCLLAADTSSRILASHVCHVWRQIALADRRLWNRFSCVRFRNQQHEDVMFALLQAMLLRSRPLPFDLEIPYRYLGDDLEYRERLLGLEAFDICRIMAYRGPARILSLLNHARQPLPSLLCLEHGPYEGIEMLAQFGPLCLPNLRRLVAPHFGFPVDGSPFLSLRSITTTGTHTNFFTHCPHLCQLEITDVSADTRLPSPPPPPSIHTIAVSCERPRMLDFVELMAGWRGIRVPRVIAREVSSLRGVLPLFLASHAQPIELRLTTPDDAVSLAALPDDKTASVNSGQPVWTIHPSPPWESDFLGSIEKPASDRLTSISVSFARLDALFRGQLHLPGLEKIEICLGDAMPADLDGPLLPGDKLTLRAPGLRRVALIFDNEYAHSHSAFFDSCQGALATLRESFRALIQYDAGLLDAILVSQQIELNCAGFAHLAKEYIPIPRGYCASA